MYLLTLRICFVSTLWKLFNGDGVDGAKWSLETLSYVVESHTQSLDKLYNYLRVTDHFWSWYTDNGSDLTKLLNRSKLKSADLKNAQNETDIQLQETRKELSELKVNFTQEISELKRLMQQESRNREKVTTDLKSELDSITKKYKESEQGIERLRKEYNESLSKVMQYSRQLSTNANATIELYKEDVISRLNSMDLKVNAVLQAQGKVQNITSSFEKRITSLETEAAKYENRSKMVADSHEKLKSSMVSLQTQISDVLRNGNVSGIQHHTLKNIVAGNGNEIYEIKNKIIGFEKNLKSLMQGASTLNQNETGMAESLEKSKLAGGIKTYWPSTLIGNSSFISQRSLGPPLLLSSLNNGTHPLNSYLNNTTSPSVTVTSPVIGVMNLSKTNESSNPVNVTGAFDADSNIGNLTTGKPN